VDASKDALGAVCYARSACEDGTVETRLIASKTKVALLATMSTPRLELSAAVMGLQLTQTVSKVLQTAISTATFWSDSTNTLWWIRGNGRAFKPFVANRIWEIQAITEPVQWRYVPTSLNPADLCTRGYTIKQSTKSEFWWQGPSLLKEDEELWPKNKVEKDLTSCEELKKRNDTPNVFVSTVTSSCWRLDPKKFSSWKRFTRVHAWINRFLQNCQLPTERRKIGELTLDEILEAELEIIKGAQRQAFPEEYSALLLSKTANSKSSKLIKLTQESTKME